MTSKLATGGMPRSASVRRISTTCCCTQPASNCSVRTTWARSRGGLVAHHLRIVGGKAIGADPEVIRVGARPSEEEEGRPLEALWDRAPEHLIKLGAVVVEPPEVEIRLVEIYSHEET